ncbi:MAG TPA: protein phosphatase 2C domain-containing protein [Microbacterium sp.]|nr:protein phosphatase 2C domain-containing protein [Microbacterium sp.]
MSDTGTHRTSNQDSAFVSASGAAVADGVGGGPAGDVASAILVHRLVAGGLGRLHDTEELRTRLRLANWDIGALTRRDDDLEGMATTFTGVFLHGAALLLAHVGDSRAYRLRDGVVTRRTRDDSYVQHLVDVGLVAAGDAATHPQRNLVTASFSGADTDSDHLTVTLESVLPGDRWMLCSDGVSDYLPEHDLVSILGSDSPGHAARALVDASLDADSMDNVTAVVADVISPRFEPAGDLSRASAAEVAFAGAAAAMFREELV